MTALGDFPFNDYTHMVESGALNVTGLEEIRMFRRGTYVSQSIITSVK